MHRAPAWELLAYLAVIGFLQVKVFIHGWRFTQDVARLVRLPGLHEGWLPGLSVDLSDVQWRDFRGSLPLLAAAMSAFLVLSHAVKLLTASTARSRTLFYAAASFVLLGVLHGWCLVYITALVSLHYLLFKLVAGRRFGVPIIWATTCAALMLVRINDGFLFSSISPGLAALDKQRGLLRWHIHYNLMVLRMLSFALDLHWARLGQPTRLKAEADAGTSGAALSTKIRVQGHQPLHLYSWLNMWVYATYPPLYIAGPIITFNNFASQLSAPTRTGLQKVATYAARWLFAWLVLELLTHTVHFNAIAKSRAWQYIEAAGMQLTPLHYAGGSYWVLVFMWLKFTVIWRFFRLVAMADGFDPPENMTRCVCNNFDVEGFWRSWHASYNQWLVRYMYVPLGGTRWRLLNVWPIFTFVALWHDLELRLLGWAWIMALAMAPEMACKAIAQTAWARRSADEALWRHACAAAAAINILVLMTGNMVGFVVGLDGVASLWARILQDPLFVAATLATLFCAAQLMFALRF